MRVYADYSGGIYFSDRNLDLPELIRGNVAERDFLLGDADSFEEAWNLLKYECGFCGSGGWNLEEVFSAALDAFPKEKERLGKFSDFGRTNREKKSDDFEILRLIGKLTGKEIRTFRYSYGNESGFFLAEDRGDAERRASKFVLRRVWDETLPDYPEISESSLEEAEKAFGKEHGNG